MATVEPASSLIFGASLLSVIWGMDPIGIDMPHLAAGMACVVVGLGGRVCFDLQRPLEGPSGNGVNLSRAIGWFGAGLIGAPFVTIMFMMILKLFRIDNDTVSVIGLVALGFLGSRGINWLMSLVEGVLRKQFGSQPNDNNGDKK